MQMESILTIYWTDNNSYLRLNLERVAWTGAIGPTGRLLGSQVVA
jgi:hypothetical protein